MRNAKVLIPESARPDDVQGSSYEEGKEGVQSKAIAKGDKLVPTAIDPAETTKAREHFGL